MKIEHKQTLVAALLSGKFKKGVGELRWQEDAVSLPLFCTIGLGAEVLLPDVKWYKNPDNDEEYIKPKESLLTIFSQEEMDKITKVNDSEVYFDDELLDMGIPEEFVARLRIENGQGRLRITTFEDMADFIKLYI